MEVEKWMIVKEKVFRVLKCSKGEKVGYATYMLQGNQDWQKLEEDKHGQESEPCAWEVLKAAFYDKYFPQSVCFQKENEFIKMK